MPEAWAASAANPSAHAFYSVQIGLGVAFILVLFFIRNREPPSRFRPKSSRPINPHLTPHRVQPGRADPLAEARLKNPKGARPALPGIVIDGHPHEVLGVKSNANQEEIQKAWRELLKHYHPDRVGRPGTREWEDAQEIAEAINRAKEEMLARLARRH